MTTRVPVPRVGDISTTRRDSQPPASRGEMAGTARHTPRAGQENPVRHWLGPTATPATVRRAASDNGDELRSRRADRSRTSLCDWDDATIESVAKEAAAEAAALLSREAWQNV